jgi:hypothetical protein
VAGRDRDTDCIADSYRRGAIHNSHLDIGQCDELRRIGRRLGRWLVRQQFANERQQNGD